MKKNSKTPLYPGKEVFIGIDVHKKTYSVVSIVDESALLNQQWIKQK